MKKPKLRELKEALNSLFSRPYTTKFPFEPHHPAKNFRGKPQFDPDKCVGCGACAQVCPSRAIEIEDDISAPAPVRRLIHYASRCIFCGQCQANCIVDRQGIIMTDQFHLAYFDEKESTHSVEHTLLVCQRCKAVIGPVKHLLWIVKRIGPLSFSHPVLITIHQESYQLQIQPGPGLKDKPLNRTDVFKIICPKCRHEAWLADEKIPT